MSLYNSLDRQRENRAVITDAATRGKAITVRLLGGDFITGTPTIGDPETTIVDSAGLTWHVSLHNVTAVGVAA